MSDVQMKGIQYFVIIAEQKKKKKFLALLNDYGARAIETVYGHGSMSPSAIAAVPASSSQSTALPCTACASQSAGG